MSRRYYSSRRKRQKSKKLISWQRRKCHNVIACLLASAIGRHRRLWQRNLIKRVELCRLEQSARRLVF
jgi:hypothetical protein